jgi:hypothetical protein
MITEPTQHAPVVVSRTTGADIEHPGQVDSHLEVGRPHEEVTMARCESAP